VIIIIMGASGAGKTTTGGALARALQWRFLDADDVHPPENVAKMRAGVGLTDSDRLPWLNAVRRQIDDAVARGESAVVACSALTRAYRDVLSEGIPSIRFVFLRADAPRLRDRLRARHGHFAGESLLPSQLAPLEHPGPEALTLDAARPVDVLVSTIRETWNL
jgi:gluconokinase